MLPRPKLLSTFIASVPVISIRSLRLPAYILDFKIHVKADKWNFVL